MSNEETLENNKLIAEFMGVKVHDSWKSYLDAVYYGPQIGNTSPFTGRPDEKTKLALKEAEDKNIYNPKYHTSWEWLMPVVEKIQGIDITPAPNYKGYRIEIVPQGYVKIEGYPMPPIFTNVSIEGSLIAAIYKAVIQFIQWYNTQPQKQPTIN